jgi:hypothetical protein
VSFKVKNCPGLKLEIVPQASEAPRVAVIVLRVPRPPLIDGGELIVPRLVKPGGIPQLELVPLTSTQLVDEPLTTTGLPALQYTSPVKAAMLCPNPPWLGPTVPVSFAAARAEIHPGLL